MCFHGVFVFVAWCRRSVSRRLAPFQRSDSPLGMDNAKELGDSICDPRAVERLATSSKAICWSEGRLWYDLVVNISTMLSCKFSKAWRGSLPLDRRGLFHHTNVAFNLQSPSFSSDDVSMDLVLPE